MTEQNVHKVRPYPETWCARCPACEHHHEALEFIETAAGAFEPDGPDRFIRCDECDTLFEVVSVQIVGEGTP